VYVLTKEEGGRHTPFETGYAPQLFFRTANVTGKVKLPPGEVGMPGKDMQMEFEMIWPVAIHTGQRFSCREGGLTVAAGIVREVFQDATDDKKGKKGAVPSAKTGAAAAAAGATKGMLLPVVPAWLTSFQEPKNPLPRSDEPFPAHNTKRRECGPRKKGVGINKWEKELWNLKKKKKITVLPFGVLPDNGELAVRRTQRGGRGGRGTGESASC
jgi:hypothetical protein